MPLQWTFVKTDEEEALVLSEKFWISPQASILLHVSINRQMYSNRDMCILPKYKIHLHDVFIYRQGIHIPLATYLNVYR